MITRLGQCQIAEIVNSHTLVNDNIYALFGINNAIDAMFIGKDEAISAASAKNQALKLLT